MLLQIHDELVFEVAEGYEDNAKKYLRPLMMGAATLAVPLVVEIGVGSNWDEAH